MSLELSVTTDGPADPQYVLELANGLAEVVRSLNHQTRHHQALHYPSEADKLIREISLAVSRLPQLLEQVSGWLEAEQATGRIGVADGSGYFTAAPVVMAARGWLERAQAQARILQQALDAAASMTTDLTGVA
jgi:hypothetical protein